MVGNDQSLIFAHGIIFQAIDADAKGEPEDQREHLFQECIRKQENGISGDDEVRYRNAQEDPGDRAPEREQRDGNPGGGHHEGGIEHVAGGDCTGARRRRGQRLHEGVERDAEEPAGGGERREVEENVPTSEGREKVERADRRGSGFGSAEGDGGCVKVDTGSAHGEGGERDRTRMNLAAHDLGTADRTGADADGEGGEEQCADRGRAAKNVAAQRRQFGNEGRAEEPEPGETEKNKEKIMLALYLEEELARVGENVEP